MITADVSDLEVEVKHLTTILSFNLYKHLSALKSPTFPYMPPYMECFNTWECPMCRINGKHMEWSFQLFQNHLNGVSWCDTTCFFFTLMCSECFSYYYYHPQWILILLWSTSAEMIWMILSSEKRAVWQETSQESHQPLLTRKRRKKRRAAWSVLIGCCAFCCRGINIPVPVLAILRNKFSLALSR